jgi:GT2 family glycosyltransferase
MAFRRSVFDALGWFFEPYKAMGLGYRYETELCVRAKRQGYKVVFSAKEPQVYHKVAERARGWERKGCTEDYLLYTNRNNTLFFLRNYWSRQTAWIFFLWDFLVGNTTQQGLLRFALYHRAPAREILIALKGKWWGWRMYRQYCGFDG